MDILYLFILNILVILLGILGMALSPMIAIFGVLICFTVLLQQVIGGISDYWLLSFTLVSFIITLISTIVGYNRQ